MRVWEDGEEVGMIGSMPWEQEEKEQEKEEEKKEEEENEE